MKTFEAPYQPVYDIRYQEKLVMEVEFDFGADPAFYHYRFINLTWY